ncbi:glycosyltransferase family 2 protein [Mesorhizobium sp. M1005]|uniref:glycosyltransferase family 2 protein n=1 Tax=unclassified Mesorhizobium TaxID=325217 RepID=UPI00333D8E6E
MKETQIPVTVVVPVKNEEANLQRCLRQLSRFSEVIVVDSSSTDRTPEVALEHGATIVNFNWNGTYPKKRNWILINQKLKNDWVLFLDADEVVTQKFCDSVSTAILSASINAYWLNYTNYFLGAPLRHGVRQRKIALFRIGKGLYEKVEEARWSNLDMEVHEHPIIEGPIGELRDNIEHNDDRGMSRFIDRHNQYASWEARRYLAVEADPTATKLLTSRQRAKYRNAERWWFPWLYFIYSYVWKLGFLDGIPGLYYSFYKTWYFLSLRLIIAEQRKQAASITPGTQDTDEQVALGEAASPRSSC